MLGISREVIEHALKIRLGSTLVKQRLHRFKEEKHRAIDEEIVKLLVAGFIKEVYHNEWLANPILVQKKSGIWRMCVDYMGLNKACPKDSFPLPRIDQVVDSTIGYETLYVGVLSKHQLVNLYLLRVRPRWCAKGHKVYTGLDRMSLRPVCYCTCY
jgi:hypothetical protein